MKWEQIPLGMMQTNCYILYDEHTCLLFDPGDDGERLIQYLESKNLEPNAILLTHAHFDHIGAVDLLRDHYRIPVYVHVNEKDWLMNPKLNGSLLFFPNRPVQAKEAEHLLREEGEFTIGSLSMELFETPGHSPGSVSYYFREAGLIVSGDVLFAGSIGRTDLPGGDYQLLMNMIKEKLLSLPEETIVLPGHGPVTVLSREKTSNPFLLNLS